MSQGDVKGQARGILDVLSAYFLAQAVTFAIVVIGGYRLRPHIDPDGKRLLLIQRRLDGKRFATVFAIDPDGNSWTVGAFNASTDFDAKKWNPS
jgi:hypothetical protein